MLMMFTDGGVLGYLAGPASPEVLLIARVIKLACLAGVSWLLWRECERFLG